MGSAPAPVSFTSLPIQASEQSARSWFAVFTNPQHEKSAVRQLELREIESFLPTY
jgi:hypothetical protein